MRLAIHEEQNGKTDDGQEQGDCRKRESSYVHRTAFSLRATLEQSLMNGYEHEQDDGDHADEKHDRVQAHVARL